MRSLKRTRKIEFTVCLEKSKERKDESDALIKAKSVIGELIKTNDPLLLIDRISNDPVLKDPAFVSSFLIQKAPVDVQMKLYACLLEKTSLVNTELAVLLKENSTKTRLLQSTCFSVLLLKFLKPPGFLAASDRLAQFLVEFYSASDSSSLDCFKQTSPIFEERRYNELLCISQLFETLFGSEEPQGPIGSSNEGIHSFAGRQYDPKREIAPLGVQNFLSFMKFVVHIPDISASTRSLPSILNALRSGIIGQSLPELELNFISLKCFLTLNQKGIGQLKRAQAMNLLTSLLFVYKMTNRYKSTNILQNISDCLALCVDSLGKEVIQSFPKYLFKRLIIRRFDRALIEKLLTKAHPEQVFASVIEFFRDSYTPDLVFLPLEDLFLSRKYRLAHLLQFIYSDNQVFLKKAQQLIAKEEINYNEALLLLGGKKLWDRFEHKMLSFRKDNFILAVLSQNIDAVKFVLSKAKTKEETDVVWELLCDQGVNLFILRSGRPSFNRVLRRLPLVKKAIYPPGIPNEEFFAISLKKGMFDDLLILAQEITETLNEKESMEKGTSKGKIAELLNGEKIKEVAGQSQILKGFLGCLPGIEEEPVIEEGGPLSFQGENLFRTYVSKERKNFELSFKFQSFLKKLAKEE